VEEGLRAAEAEGLVPRIERPAFDARGEPGRAFPVAGDDIDHPAERVGAIEAAFGAAQHLDAGDVGRDALPEIEGAVLTGIVDVDPIDDDLGVIAVGAPDEDRGEAARPSGLELAKAGDGGEGVRQRTPLMVLDPLSGDQGEGTADLVDGGRREGGGDDQRRYVRCGRAGILGPGRRRGLEGE
jgi:hypothetical protein